MARKAAEYPELLRDLAVHVAVVALDYLPAEVAGRMGVDAAEHLRRQWAGRIVYVPGGLELDRRRRDAEILRDWAAGCTVDELAERHHVTPRRIKQILSVLRPAP